MFKNFISLSRFKSTDQFRYATENICNFIDDKLQNKQHATLMKITFKDIRKLAQITFKSMRNDLHQVFRLEVNFGN